MFIFSIAIYVFHVLVTFSLLCFLFVLSSTLEQTASASPHPEHTTLTAEASRTTEANSTGISSSEEYYSFGIQDAESELFTSPSTSSSSGFTSSSTIQDFTDIFSHQKIAEVDTTMDILEEEFSRLHITDAVRDIPQPKETIDRPWIPFRFSSASRLRVENLSKSNAFTAKSLPVEDVPTTPQLKSPFLRGSSIPPFISCLTPLPSDRDVYPDINANTSSMSLNELTVGAGTCFTSGSKEADDQASWSRTNRFFSSVMGWHSTPISRAYSSTTSSSSSILSSIYRTSLKPSTERNIYSTESTLTASKLKISAKEFAKPDTPSTAIAITEPSICSTSQPTCMTTLVQSTVPSTPLCTPPLKLSTPSAPMSFCLEASEVGTRDVSLGQADQLDPFGGIVPQVGSVWTLRKPELPTSDSWVTISDSEEYSRGDSAIEQDDFTDEKIDADEYKMPEIECFQNLGGNELPISELVERCWIPDKSFEESRVEWMTPKWDFNNYLKDILDKLRKPLNLPFAPPEQFAEVPNRGSDLSMYDVSTVEERREDSSFNMQCSFSGDAVQEPRSRNAEVVSVLQSVCMDPGESNRTCGDMEMTSFSLCEEEEQMSFGTTDGGVDANSRCEDHDCEEQSGNPYEDGASSEEEDDIIIICRKQDDPAARPTGSRVDREEEAERGIRHQEARMLEEEVHKYHGAQKTKVQRQAYSFHEAERRTFYLEIPPRTLIVPLIRATVHPVMPNRSRSVFCLAAERTRSRRKYDPHDFPRDERKIHPWTLRKLKKGLLPVWTPMTMQFDDDGSGDVRMGGDLDDDDAMDVDIGDPDDMDVEEVAYYGYGSFT